MAIYRRKGQEAWLIAVPTRHGRVKRSTGVTYKPLAKSMDRMLVELGPAGKRAWDLLDRVADGTVSLADLHEAWVANDLNGLREKLADVDLSPEVDVHLDRLASRVTSDLVSHYRHMIRSLIPAGKPFPRSGFTVDAIEAWLSKYPASSSTRRKAHAAMSGFAKYLVKAHMMSTNPLPSVEIPRASPPRLRYIGVADMKRLADAHKEPYRALSALLGGTGIEISVALELRRRDVDERRREIRAAGTKTYCRDRTVRVAEWAWPYVERLISDLLPNAPLFPGLNRFTVSDKHVAACKALEIHDYQLRDQRHSYAVRAARAGTPIELISRALGHADATLALRVYGRFLPSQQERDTWERIAAAQDAAVEESQQMGAILGAVQQ